MKSRLRLTRLRGIRSRLAGPRTIVCSSACTFVALAVGFASDPANSADGQTLLRRYIEALPALERRYSVMTVDGIHTLESAIGTPKQKKSVDRNLLERGTHGQRYISSRSADAGPAKGLERAFVRNGKQAFVLDRKDPGAKYELKHIAGVEDESVDRSLRLGFGRIEPVFCGNMGIPQKELLSDPGFKATRIEAITLEGAPALKVEFELESKRKEEKYAWTKSGSFVVSPDMGWVIREYDCELRAPLAGVKNSMRIDYEKAADGTFIPKKIVDKRSHEAIHTFEIESVSFTDPPAEHFNLEFYGLPTLDAPGAPTKRGNLVPWLLGLAALAMAAAAALRVYVRRSSLPGAA